MKSWFLKIKKKYKKKKKKFLISYSGGLDSTILLKLTNKKKTTAIHIDHNQNEISYICIQHCRKTCKKIGINLIIKKIKIKNIQKHGFESKARLLRYKKIQKNIKNNEILLTGHHKNDQTETLLLSLKRGCGPLGLSGIAKTRNFGKNLIKRPLINISKKKLHKISIKKKIIYINDISNKNTIYDRNFLRIKVIPLLKKRWKYFDKNIIKTINLCNKQNTLIKYFLRKTIKNLSYNNKTINIIKIKFINKNFLNYLLKYWIKNIYNISISKKNLQQIINKIIITKKKKNTIIIKKKILLEKYKNKLFLKKYRKTINNIDLNWENTKIPLIMPYKLGFLIFKKKKKIYKTKKINIKFRKKGKFMTVDKKKIFLKNIWNQNNIPKNKRKKTPLLFYKNKFIKIIGVLKNN